MNVKTSLLSTAHNLTNYKYLSLKQKPQITLSNNINELNSERGEWYELEVEEAVVGAKGLRLKFVGINNKESASNLVGAVVGIKRALLPVLPSGEYYWVDLIGLTVINHEDIDLGKVIDLLESGSNAVLVVAPKSNSGDDYSDIDGNKKYALANRLIPFVSAYVVQVDLTNGFIIVEWGLDY